MPLIKMRVFKYLPAKLYGFLNNPADYPDLVVYFHLGEFKPGDFPFHALPCMGCTGCAWSTTPPSPVLGEWVDVELPFDPLSPPNTGNRAPKALSVTRTSPTLCLRGLVESFDAMRGYGFIRGEDGTSYHLHRSEVLRGLLPVVGEEVRFFSGTRDGRPRACYVKICR